MLDPDNAFQLQIANIVSWVAADAFAYSANRIFVFESKNPHILLEVTAFVSARIATLLMDMFCMFTMVTCLEINDKIAKLVVRSL